MRWGKMLPGVGGERAWGERARPAHLRSLRDCGQETPAPRSCRQENLSPGEGAPTRPGWGGRAQGGAGTVVKKAKFPEDVLQGMSLSCCRKSSHIAAK